MKNIAIISGASSGIGKEFCEQVDSYGFDEIWGIALEEDKLEETKKLLKTKFVPFAMDLTNEENVKQIVEKLKKTKPNVKLLVNCSGFGKFGRYDEIPTETSAKMVELNCISLVKMTEYVLPYMQKGGNIIQVSSVASFQPVPYLAVYGATKAFVLSYSRAINVELKNKGITCTALCPFWTKTNFFKVAKTTNEGVISYYAAMYLTKDVVKRALKGAKKRKELVTYGFVSKFQQFLSKILPHRLISKIWCKQQKIDKKYKNK